ncbi:MAG: PaaI family thioesterase [Desulfohalobiaceae bacterium]|nr:PaaI family thioesterase [Desulfohalobiaceae bacterium]
MDILEFGKQVLSSQPFSLLVGAELTAFSQGRAELRIPVTPHLKQQHGSVHGGVLSYAADNALTFAGGSVLGPEVVTSEFKINYLRPAQGTDILVRAEVVSSGRTQAVCRCEIFAVSDGKEALCAIALGTIAGTSRAKHES